MTHDMLLQQDGLHEVGQIGYFNEDNPYYIYIICKRPRITLNSKDFKTENGKILLPFQIQRQDKFEKIYVEMPYQDEPNIQLITEYPYNLFEIRESGGKLIQSGKTALLFQTLRHKDQSLLDLEVLYIGQSYGVEGARTAPDRLKSHSTLQGIYSEAILRNPDSEIWLLLTSFEQILLTSIDGTMKVREGEIKRDAEHLKKVTNSVLYEGLKEQQVINFTEAALIRYFQPLYNIEYKYTFPNPAHSTYLECYELDINSVCIEVNTENINCRLYSPTVPAHWWHMKDFFLHSKVDRKSMFDYGKPIR